MAYTENIPSPRLFRLWAAIASVGASLERRVWLETSAGKLYPNLFVMLVAPPAVGKGQAIDTAVDLWRVSRKISVAPDSMTKASLLDKLMSSGKKLMGDKAKALGATAIYEYSSLSIGVEEFGTLLPAHDMEFLSFLIRLYNNPDNLSEDRRTSTSVDIHRPQLNMLVGSQPGFLAHLLPEEAWEMGFMSRMIMVFATSGPDWEIFGGKAQAPAARTALARQLEANAELVGPFDIADDYKAALNNWKRAGYPPSVEHSKLRHYNGRRLQMAIKLAMISAVSRGNGLLVDASDHDRAHEWMVEAEAKMPDIFREMSHKSDNQIIMELHSYLWREFSRDKKPLTEAQIYLFLKSKAPSDRIPKIIETAERADLLIRHVGQPPTYSPMANKHGAQIVE